MKIVAFEGQAGPHFGVVEGDQVVDLQAADSKVPSDLGAWLAQNNGDTKLLGEIARRAPASARMPLAGLKHALPAGENHLPRIELSRPRQGRLAARQHSEISDDLLSRPDLHGAARPADHPAANLRNTRL